MIFTYKFTSSSQEDYYVNGSPFCSWRQLRETKSLNIIALSDTAVINRFAWFQTWFDYLTMAQYNFHIDAGSILETLFPGIDLYILNKQG